MVRASFQVATWTALALGLLGCSRGCDDKPYVPYQIGDAAPSGAPSAAPSASGDAGEAVDAAVPSAEVDLRDAPPESSRWLQSGFALEAPEGYVFARGMFRDLDGDGTLDALVTTRRLGEVGAQVLFYPGRHGEAPTPTVLLANAKLEGDASCSVGSNLTAAGKHGVLVELSLSCAERVGTGAVRRLLLLGRRQGELVVRAQAELLDGADVLQVSGSTDDRDGDQIDDVQLTFRVVHSGGKGRPLPVTWLDRPAGLSRDLAEPEATLLKLAGDADQRAKSAKDARSAVSLASDVLALSRVLCGPRPRVRIEQPSLSCGESRAVERTALAKLRAYVTLKEPHFALPTYEALRRDLGERKEADKLVRSVLSMAPVRELRELQAIPEEVPGQGPFYGPLTFEADGSLIIKTRDELVRVNPQTYEEQTAPGLRYLATVASPDAAYSWLEAYDPCDGVALRMTLAPITVGDIVDIPLPVAASLGRCGGKGEQKRTAPLSWTGQALHALVEGFPVRVKLEQASAELGLPDASAPQAPGSARSPNGKLYAWSSSLGLFVGGAGRVLTHDAFGKFESLRSCTVANDGVTAACVRDGKVVWLKATAPSQ